MLTRPVLVSSLLALVSVGCVILFLSLIQLRSDLNRVVADSRTHSDSAAATLVGYLGKSLDAVWCEGQAERFHAEPLFAGDVIELSSGSVAIRLLHGVDVSVEGPAIWIVESPTRSSLKQGKLRANVPHSPSVTKFTVRTPVGEVVDLGTEFGVQVESEGTTHFHVFDGSVAVSLAEASDSQRAPPTVLHAGEGMRVELSGSTERIVSNDEMFVRVRDIGIREDFRRWRAYSRKLAQDPSLVAYYTFEIPSASFQRSSFHRLSNTAALTRGRFDGRLGDGVHPDTAPHWTSGRWKGKGALSFNKFRKQRVVVDDWHRQTLDKAMTFAAWVRLRDKDSTDWTVIASQCNYRVTPKEYFFHFSVQGAPLGSPSAMQRLILRLADDGVHARTFCDAQQSACGWWARDGWTHVAFTAETGGAVRIYQNGRLVSTASEPLRPQSFPTNTQPLVIGGAVRGVTSFMHGVIDEVAIFKRALSEAEIQTMYQVGRRIESDQPGEEQDHVTTRSARGASDRK
jgi:hypothetical protein